MTAEPVPGHKDSPPRLTELRDRAKAREAARAAATTVGQLPAPVNLILYQGDDFILDLVFSGSPGLDMNLYTPKAEIRATAGAAQLIASFDAAVIDTTTVRLHLSHAQAELLVGDAAWDCQITDSAGTVTTVAYGSVALTKQVTK